MNNPNPTVTSSTGNAKKWTAALACVLLALLAYGALLVASPFLIMRAVERDNDKGVRFLLASGARPSFIVVGANGLSSPLLEATRRGNWRAARALVNGGADVNATSAQGYAPLHEAACAANTDMVRLLLKHGAKVDQKDGYKYTPLAYALEGRARPVTAQIRAERLTIMRLLLDAGADPKKATFSDRYTLAKARMHLPQAVPVLVAAGVKP